MSEKRNRDDGMPALPAGAYGVGGRQSRDPLPTWGGGYLDICTDSRFQKTAPAGAADPRLDELRQIGLPYRWLQVARAIGVDAFLVVWQILDQENHDATGQQISARVRVPMFSRYLKFQRNRYVRTLAESGRSPAEIRELVRTELCEELSERHIARIIGSAVRSTDNE